MTSGIPSGTHHCITFYSKTFNRFNEFLNISYIILLYLVTSMFVFFIIYYLYLSTTKWIRKLQGFIGWPWKKLYDPILSADIILYLQFHKTKTKKYKNQITLELQYVLRRTQEVDSNIFIKYYFHLLSLKKLLLESLNLLILNFLYLDFWIIIT